MPDGGGDAAREAGGRGGGCGEGAGAGRRTTVAWGGRVGRAGGCRCGADTADCRCRFTLETTVDTTPITTSTTQTIAPTSRTRWAPYAFGAGGGCCDCD